MNIYNWLRTKYFPSVVALPAGICHYQSDPNITPPYRLHLRLNPDGSGILIVNARTILQLNQTAAELIYHHIQRTPHNTIANIMAKRYRVKAEEIRSDYQKLIERITTLVTTPDLDPVSSFEFERSEPYSANLTAPLRLDCALTYRQSHEMDTGTAPQERVRGELNLDEWVTILGKSWSAGIPHVVFTGGEPTLHPNLVDLISYAESLGQVTGLLTDGTRLSNREYLASLLKSGLDHLMIVLDPVNQEAWQAIQIIIPEDIFTTIHYTVTSAELELHERYVRNLVDLGVRNLSLSCISKELKPTLDQLTKITAEWDMNLYWDLPVPYSHFNPVALEIEAGIVTRGGAGKAWLYIEPDGDVTPFQGSMDVLGNLLTDQWQSIWEKAGK